MGVIASEANDAQDTKTRSNANILLLKLPVRAHFYSI